MKTRTITSGIRSLVRMEPLIGKIIVFFVLLNLQYFRNEIVFKFMWQMNIKPQLVNWSCQPLNQNWIQAFIKPYLLFINDPKFWNMKVWISLWKFEFLYEILKIWNRKIHVICTYVMLFCFVWWWIGKIENCKKDALH